MEPMLHNCSVSFEIPLADDRKSSTVIPTITTPKRNSFTEVDMNEKLKKAEERRSRVLTDTRNKNEQHVKMVKTKLEQLKGEEVTQSNIRLENLYDDLAQKSKRRQIIIEEKVEKAKKLAELRVNTDEIGMRYANDLIEKENNRKCYLQGIVEACQTEKKVDEVRSRRSLMSSWTNES